MILKFISNILFYIVTIFLLVRRRIYLSLYLGVDLSIISIFIAFSLSSQGSSNYQTILRSIRLSFDLLSIRALTIHFGVQMSIQMVFSLSPYMEVMVVLSNDGFFITVGSISFLLVFLLGIRYLLPFLKGFPGSILVCSINLLRLSHILLA